MQFTKRACAALAIGTGVVIAACSHDLPTSIDTRASREVGQGPEITAQQRNLTELTRQVALALGDSLLRQRTLGDIRESRVAREHKLKLRSYVRGTGAGLVPAMARASGRHGAPSENGRIHLRTITQ